jgi:hypothetical protein
MPEKESFNRNSYATFGTISRNSKCFQKHTGKLNNFFLFNEAAKYI